MGSESLFRLVSLLVFGVVVTACAALQQSSQTETQSQAPEMSLQAEVESLTEVHQINTGQYRPYEMGTLKAFSDSGQGFETDPNL